jgi:hypothetical protein
MVQDQYARIGRTGFGGETNQIDVPGFNNFVNELQTGRIRPEQLSGRFDTAVQDYMRTNPNDRYTEYVRNFQGRQERPITTMPVTPPSDEINHFGIDEYGRKAGEGFGTAPPPGMQPIYQPAVTQPAITNTQITDYLKANPGMTDAQIRGAMDQFGVGVDQMASATGLPLDQIQQRYNAAQIANTPGMGMAGIGMNFPGLDGTRIPGEGPGLFGNTTGIASLAEGGYPRRNGQISGPGTEKSDSIPAMLSDGEFVMTAKAVRGAGKGNRRAGAKQMYKLMHQLEKNAERG